MPALTPEELQIRFSNDLDLLNQFMNGLTSDVVVTGNGSLPTLAKLASRSNTQFLQLAASDMNTAIIPGYFVSYARVVNAGVFNTIRASLSSPSTAGIITIDVKVNSVSVLSTPLTIDVGSKTSLNATIPAVISNGSVADDDEVSIDIIDAGAGAKGLIITLLTV